MFGREVRRLLKVLNDSWFPDNVICPSQYQFVQKFKEKLNQISNLAQTYLKEYQIKMKENFDTKSVSREFNQGTWF